MSYRTPTANVKGLGTSKHGFSHWWMQRLSAALLMPTGLFVLFSISLLDPISSQSVSFWIASPLNAAVLLIFVLTACHHSALGLQVVIEDYVHGAFAQLLFRYITKLIMLLAALVGGYSIIKILFGL